MAMRKIYLDHNATTPVRAEVFEAMKPLLTDHWGNPSSVHWIGREAKDFLDEARSQVAAFMGADPSEIVFTSCGSESDNQAIKGIATQYAKRGRHIITTTVEHPAVLETCRHLESMGHAVTYVPVDRAGMVDMNEYRKSFRDDTVLVSSMMANNETGNIFPIKEMAAYAKERRVLFHTDAVQAAGKIHLNVRDLGVDLLTISGHKIYAPKGVGALYVRKGVKIANLIHGGHQEDGRRAGTENVAGIVALGVACELAEREIDALTPRLLQLRNKLEKGVLEKFDEVKLNGHPTSRVPNTSNISFFYVEGESILLDLDLEGVAASSGSACSSESSAPSPVLTAMCIPPEQSRGALRFSLGRENTIEDVDYVLEVLPPIIERLRSLSPLYRKKKAS